MRETSEDTLGGLKRYFEISQDMRGSLKKNLCIPRTINTPHETIHHISIGWNLSASEKKAPAL